MKQSTRWMTNAVLVLVLVFGFAARLQAADLPLAAASPMTGVAFDDRPLLLPVQRNFQMAMLTAGSELGRSCGKMEAYGWRMSQTDQGRVNQIFNNTVDRLRLLGYSIAPQTLNSVSKDITLFTADRNDRHFMFLWSAGELGLVLNLCETTAPVTASNRPGSLVPSVQTFPVPMDVVPSRLDAMQRSHANAGEFTPLGEWVGGYTCAQGYTGGTLQIEHVRGQDFDGVFKFYPTVKNPHVPAGSYNVYGQYDKDSKRILINPGKWIKRPRNFYNTVIVGSFDPNRDAFSAYFQGISGCTSFEASRSEAPYIEHMIKAKPKKHVVKKKKPVKKAAPAVTSDMLVPLTTDIAPAVSTTPAIADAPPISAPATAPTVNMPVLPPPPAAAAPAPAAVMTAPAQAPALPDADKSSGGILLAPARGK